MTAPAKRAIDVTAVGELLVDFVATDVRDLSNATTFVRTAGGAPANVAVAIAKLGQTSAFVGAVGSDPFGAYLEEVLSANGVLTAGIKRVADRTTLAFVAQNRGSIPDFVFYRGADRVLLPDDLPATILGKSTFVHVSSMALMGEPSRATTLAAAEKARGWRALVSFDVNLRPSSWPSLAAAVDAVGPLVATANLLKLNDEEAHYVAGTRDLHQALETLGHEQALVVITRGPDGCLWRWKGETGMVKAPSVEVADTTGAGDAFLGALLAELCAHGYSVENFTELRREELEAALSFACAAAALSCTRPGAIASLPTRPEIADFVTKAA